MKKLIFTGMLSLVALFGLYTAAFAEVEAQIDDNSVVTVYLSFDSCVNEKIAVEVLNPGMDEDDIKALTPETAFEVYSYITEADTDSSGRASFSYTLSDKSGSYSVRVKRADSASEFYENVFTYVSPGFSENFIAEYCSETTTDVRRLEMLETEHRILGIDTEMLSSMDEEAKLNLIALAGTDFDSVADFKAAFETAVIMSLINDGADSGAIEEAIEKYSVGFSSFCETQELWDTYFTDGEKAALFKAADNSGFETLSEFTDGFNDLVFLGAVKNADSYQQLEAILEMSEEWLGEDFSDYYSLGSKKTVALKIMNAQYDSPNALCKALHRAVSDAKSEPKSAGSSSKASTSGSSLNMELALEQSADIADKSTAGTAADFIDLSDAQWAAEAIYALRSAGIINGISENLFAPMNNVTREEFVKMLVLAFFDVDSGAVAGFEDVSPAHWSYPYVATAKKLGIVNGISATEFGIGEAVTRQDIAALVYRTADMLGIELREISTVEFSDFEEIAPYASGAVSTLASAGVLNGMDDGAFYPDGSATRAQAAKIVYELMVKGGLI